MKITKTLLFFLLLLSPALFAQEITLNEMHNMLDAADVNLTTVQLSLDWMDSNNSYPADTLIQDVKLFYDAHNNIIKVKLYIDAFNIQDADLIGKQYVLFKKYKAQKLYLGSDIDHYIILNGDGKLTPVKSKIRELELHKY